MDLFDKIMTLTRSLYPTGRAFKMPFGGFLEKLHLGLVISEVQAYEDATSILHSILPDNANFTVDDATDWERRLGLITNSLVSLTNRKLAIIRKLNQPGINPAKGYYLNLQRELQAAGFDVYVFENPSAVSPFDYCGISLTAPIQHGQVQHGQVQHGLTFTNKIANRISESEDLYYQLGGSYKSTFFIGKIDAFTGDLSYANVPIARKDEFRQLILKIKQVQSIGFLFINYV